MPNNYFAFKQFTVQQQHCAMKVTTDSCLFGAWCAQQLQQLNKTSQNVLDIGTGTGLLSLMCAQKNNVTIDAVEIDTAAAAQAAQNFSASSWKAQLQVVQQDITRMDFLKSYDAIICNPPFYENELQSENKLRNTAHHSQQLQLNTLLSILNKALEQEGLFFLLLPFKRKTEAETLLQQNHLYAYKEVLVHQTTGHAPFRVMWTGGRKNNVVKESSNLCITDNERQYTPDFTTLLKDYYQKL